MKTALELNHLAPYLPYGLNLKHPSNAKHYKLRVENINDCIRLTNSKVQNEKFKPILRPLTDYYDVNGGASNDLNIDISDQIALSYLASGEEHHTSASYHLMEICFVNHIDVFGLIDKGLAIDINTLDK